MLTLLQQYLKDTVLIQQNNYLKNSYFVIFFLTFLLFNFKTANGETIYNGTLIDAHSQVGILISNEEVSKEINNNDVYLTLLSMRGKHENATKRYKSIQKQTQGKVRYLISTKLKGFARKKRDANKAISGIKAVSYTHLTLPTNREV